MSRRVLKRVSASREKVNRPRFALSRANTFIYGYDFRRVKVEENTLQVFPIFVPVLAAAVRVGGPSFTWLRDTRDNPVDAHRGTYTSFQEFLSAKPFGAEAQFNRIDTTWSSYYGFLKDKFVIARNTRFGDERAFGTGSSELLPLPERLYAGGATSLRSFSINAAGPRDPDTGFPIGGAGALVNNTELRLPPTPLPYFGEMPSALCSLKTWATCLPTRRHVGQHSPDPAAGPCQLRKADTAPNSKNQPSEPGTRRPGDVTSARWAHAASIIFRRRRASAFAITPRSAPSAWISAIPSIRPSTR